MGILRTVAVAAIGVVAYRAWQRYQAGEWSTRSEPDYAGTTPPHGDPRGGGLAGEDQLSTAAAGSNVVGLGGTQAPDTGLADEQRPRGGQSSPGFGD